MTLRFGRDLQPRLDRADGLEPPRRTDPHFHRLSHGHHAVADAVRELANVLELVRDEPLRIFDGKQPNIRLDPPELVSRHLAYRATSSHGTAIALQTDPDSKVANGSEVPALRTKRPRRWQHLVHDVRQPLVHKNVLREIGRGTRFGLSLDC